MRVNTAFSEVAGEQIRKGTYPRARTEFAPQLLQSAAPLSLHTHSSAAAAHFSSLLTWFLP